MSTFKLVALLVSGFIITLIIVLGIIQGKKEGNLPADLHMKDPGIAPEEDKPQEFPAPATEEVLPDAESQPVIVDQNAIRAGYFKMAKQHRKATKSANSNIMLFFIIQGVLLLFVSFMAISAGDNTGLIVLLGLVIYLPMLGYYVVNRSKRLSQFLTTSKYVELKGNQFPRLWSTCNDLISRMDLSTFSLHIVYVKTDAFEASVVAEENHIYLLLSRSLIAYYHDHPKDVESIIGHEFGHAFQGDTKLMLVTKSTIQIPAIIGSISLVILMIQAIISLLSHQGLPQVTGSLIIVVNYWQLVGQRREAEHLADLASLVFVEGCTIQSLIDKYMPEKGTMNYPSRQQRLAFLERMKKRFPLAETPVMVVEEGSKVV